MQFKKALILLLTLLLLSSCNASQNNNNSAEKNTNTINFDLSQYIDHGELSCGRIWASIEDGDWDSTNVEKFAYFDSDGNKLTDWYKSDDWIPFNYNNNFAIILKEDYYGREWKHHQCKIFNIDGKCIADFSVYNERGSGFFRDRMAISDFNSDGMCCGYGMIEGDECIFWVDAKGEHLFNIDPDILISESSDSFEATKIGEYIGLYLESGLSNYYAGIFDKNGDLVLNVTEALDKKDVYSIKMNEDNFEVIFEGSDNKTYTCILDEYGNFVKKPY